MYRYMDSLHLETIMMKIYEFKAPAPPIGVMTYSNRQ